VPLVPAAQVARALSAIPEWTAALPFMAAAAAVAGRAAALVEPVVSGGLGFFSTALPGAQAERTASLR
jgi:hypothetical protein